MKAAATVITPWVVVEKEVNHVKENIKEETEEIVTKAIMISAIAIVSFFFVLFLSFTVAYVLNVALNSYYWGFAIVGLFYLILFAVLLIIKGRESEHGFFRSQARRILKFKH